MSTTTVDKPARSKPGRPAKAVAGAKLVSGRSAEAKRLAAAILEVLAGTRTPAEAALALGVSVPRYYQVETRALGGLLDACEPRPRGPRPDSAREVTTLRHENQRLERELTRQQSLARTAQRAIGLAPPPRTPAAPAGKKRRRRRLARGLAVAQRLQKDVPVATPAAPATGPSA